MQHIATKGIRTITANRSFPVRGCLGFIIRFSSFRTVISAVFLLGCVISSIGAPNFEPDVIAFKDGTSIHGLIVRYSLDSITMVTGTKENTFPKKDIVRIRDEAQTGVYFADANRRGSLPPWKTIANDLRTLDEVKSLKEVRAAVIANGPFRDVPYLAFRINSNIELNIYGDAEEPAGIELGILGKARNSKNLRASIRTFLASFLFSRPEIAAAYDLDLNGGKKRIGSLVLEISSPSREQAWRFSAYYPHRLEEARMKESERRAMTVPAKTRRSPAPAKIKGADSRIFLREFYRDKSGAFRLP